MKVLLVTIAIGEKYLQEYETLFKKSQEEYAKKYGYDFKVVTEFLDKNIQNKSTISFNKTLVACQEWSTDYDFIIFIDADIFININSPPIHNYIEYGNCIGVIDEYSQPSKEKRLNIQRINGWETCATDYYKLSGFDIQTDMVLNSGVLVLQPKLHGTFLQKIYNDYVIQSISSPRGFHFEQSCVGYELQKAKKYKILDNKFNAIWNLTKSDDPNINLEDYFTQNYFIHFAGHVDYHKVNLLNNIHTN